MEVKVVPCRGHHCCAPPLADACPARPSNRGSALLTRASSSPLEEAGRRRAAEKGSPQLREGDNFSRESLAEVAGGKGREL